MSIVIKGADSTIINQKQAEQVELQKALEVVNQKIKEKEDFYNNSGSLAIALNLRKADRKYDLDDTSLGIFFPYNNPYEAIRRIANGKGEYSDRECISLHKVNSSEFFKSLTYIGRLVKAYNELPNEEKARIWEYLRDFELWQYDYELEEAEWDKSKYPVLEDIVELQKLCNFSEEIVDNGLYVSEETMETINTISENIEKIEIVYFLIKLIMVEFAEKATHEKTLLEKEREEILKRLNKINSFLTLINN